MRARRNKWKKSAYNIQKQMQICIRIENIYSFTEHIVIKDLLYINCWQYCGEKNTVFMEFNVY